MATRVESESDGISAAVRSPSHRFRSNDRSDFISSLPDAIIHHILSYIPTESFHVDVTFNNFSLTPSHVHSWIELAASRNAENMSIIIIGSDNVLPEFFFTNSSVKQLRLSLGRQGNYNYCDMIPKCTVLWTTLRSLSLECCGESLANILSGCPMLESLVLIFCQHLHHIDLSKSIKLTRLEITTLFFHVHLQKVLLNTKE
ncbi:hypothetical protein F2Q69_00017238 [Brassica cretica]|uniref:F-box/LRR-repeat protein 15/At3g58940/PEG3-like LRR domain-containing protein n=1 Tax=Brassica cretica TaxID=69181 RepID=A0A8S9R910_BRACR|nr:hypothetical protein F2Q69_00017238 [Brassica cretica]